jgi:hypothetical protein
LWEAKNLPLCWAHVGLYGLHNRSFLQGSTGCAFVYEEQVFKCLLHSFNILRHLPSFSIYLVALLALLPHLLRLPKCLTESQGHMLGHPFVLEIPQQVFHPTRQEVCCILFGTRPCRPAMSEATLLGNVAVDWAAGSDGHAYLHYAVLLSWQDRWTQTVDDILWAVKPTVQVWHSSHSSNRAAWLQIGYAHLTCSHQLRVDPALVCSHSTCHAGVPHLPTKNAKYSRFLVSYTTLWDDCCNMSSIMAFVPSIEVGSFI